MVMSDSGKTEVTKQEYAELEFQVQLRTYVDSLFNSYIDIKAIAAPSPGGTMLTWSHLVVQVQVQICCKKLFSKLKLPLHISLQCLFFKFTRDMGGNKYDGKWADHKDVAVGADDVEDLTTQSPPRKPKRKAETAMTSKAETAMTSKSKTVKTAKSKTETAKTSKSKTVKMAKSTTATKSKTATKSTTATKGDKEAANKKDKKKHAQQFQVADS